MPEINSLEAAKVAAGNKLSNDEALGRIKAITISSPAAAAWAQDDTIASPVDLPVGTRILGFKVFHGALGTGVLMDIGLRASPHVDPAQTVIDVDGIADGLDVAAAGIKSELGGVATTGTYIDVTDNTVTRLDKVANIYASLLGADPTDDAQFRIDVIVALPG
jgi:hypothetical protein